MVCASNEELKTTVKDKDRIADRNRDTRMDRPLLRREWGRSFERVCGDKFIALCGNVNTRRAQKVVINAI